jgi:hypothetical protein
VVPSATASALDWGDPDLVHRPTPSGHKASTVRRPTPCGDAPDLEALARLLQLHEPPTDAGLRADAAASGAL